jgi:hypothetical protein
VLREVPVDDLSLGEVHGAVLEKPEQSVPHMSFLGARRPRILGW